MTIQEIQTYLETNKEQDDVKTYLQGLKSVTVEDVNNYVSTDDGMKWLSKHNDSFFNKGLETWKQNNLKTIIDEAISKANPKETPEQKQIRELTERLNKKEADEKRQTLLNKSYVLAVEKKLPKDILEHFLGDDEQTTISRISIFKTY